LWHHFVVDGVGETKWWQQQPQRQKKVVAVAEVGHSD
jgi:hypothetical protein